MSGPRIYPDEPAGPFEGPPVSFTDDEDRTIEVRAYDPEEFDALVEMYLDFDPADRAQGIPPTGEQRVSDWLDALVSDGLNVVAWHDETAVGHATLVPHGGGKRPDEEPDYENDEHELAIFVLQGYQGVGIGERLLRTLLGYGTANGVTHVWLSVERWNRAAIGLYEKLGFETCGAESFEVEMSVRVVGDGDA